MKKYVINQKSWNSSNTQRTVIANSQKEAIKKFKNGEGDDETTDEGPDSKLGPLTVESFEVIDE